MFGVLCNRDFLWVKIVVFGGLQAVGGQKNAPMYSWTRRKDNNALKRGLFFGFPGTEVGTLFDPFADQGFFFVGHFVTFGRHEEVVVFGQKGGFQEIAFIRFARNEGFAGFGFSTFHDGFHAIQCETTLGLFDATILFVFLGMTADALGFDDREDLFLEVHGGILSGKGVCAGNGERNSEDGGKSRFHEWV